MTPVFGLIQSECDEPSLFKKQPAILSLFSNRLLFIRSQLFPELHHQASRVEYPPGDLQV